LEGAGRHHRDGDALVLIFERPIKRSSVADGFLDRPPIAAGEEAHVGAG
jgi:hypothetical protein